MTTLILHAGFPKCGSTSIVSTLKANLGELENRNVYVIDKSFGIQRSSKKFSPPLWELQKAVKEPDKAREIKRKLLEAAQSVPQDSVLILSSENLSKPIMADIFAGLDRIFEMRFIFYFRPQVDWIPSAWKQWNLKENKTLSETIRDYVAINRPGYLDTVHAWQRALPDLHIEPRFFIREYMKNGNPSEDFFGLLGLEAAMVKRGNSISNPSIDHALLHLMMRNSDRLFKNRHDNAVPRALLKHLPPEYHKTNATMLSQDQANFISGHFRESNLELIQKFMGYSAEEAEEIVRKHFYSIVSGHPYTEMTEEEMLGRATNILKEMTDVSDQKEAIELLLEIIGPNVIEAV